MQPSLNQDKKKLFSHADPSLAIREMKSMTSHLNKTRELLHQSLDLMGNIKVGVSNTSSHLIKTSEMYDDYQGQLRRADLYIKGLEKKEKDSQMKIKFAFWFLVAVVIYVWIRRILFPGLYRGLFTFK